MSNYCEIYPQLLSPAIMDDPDRAAQRKVFDCLKRLPQGWLVFYSVSCQTPDEWFLSQNGQLDFLLIHPKFGILILEVVGGAVSYHGQDIWFCCSRDMVSRQINPPRRLVENRQAVIDFLRQNFDLQNQSIPIATVVATPDMRSDDPDAHLQHSGEFLIGKEHLHDMAKRLFEIGTATRTTISAPRYVGTPGSRAFAGDDLTALIRSTLSRAVVVSDRFHLDEAGNGKQLRLTREQSRLLQFMQAHHRVRVDGCAGSGKTLLAIERAAQLSTQGYKVLLTCRNRQMAARMEKALSGTAVTTRSFYALCKNIADTCALELPSAPEQYYSLLRDTAAGRPDLQFDAIIVDEAHDFEKNWWSVLGSLLKDRESSVLYVFQDENQKLFFRDNCLPQGLERFKLDENLRSPRAVSEHLRRHIINRDDPVARGPVGQPIDIIIYCEPDATAAGDEDASEQFLSAAEHASSTSALSGAGPSVHDSSTEVDTGSESKKSGSSYCTAYEGKPDSRSSNEHYASSGGTQSQNVDVAQSACSAMLAALPGAVSRSIKRSSLNLSKPSLVPQTLHEKTIANELARSTEPISSLSAPCVTSLITDGVQARPTVRQNSSSEPTSRHLPNDRTKPRTNPATVSKEMNHEILRNSSIGCVQCLAAVSSKSSSSPVAKSIEQILPELLEQQHCTANSIVVLTMRRLQSSDLRGITLRGGIRLVDHHCNEPDTVLLASVHSFTGMEKDTVIVVEVDRQYLEDPYRAQLSYIALSRACNRLIVIGTAPGIDDFLLLPYKSDLQQQLELSLIGLRSLVERVHGSGVAPAQILRGKGFPEDAINSLAQHPYELMKFFTQHLRTILSTESEQLISEFNLDCSPPVESPAARSAESTIRKPVQSLAFPDTLKPVIEFALAEAAADTLYSI